MTSDEDKNDEQLELVQEDKMNTTSYDSGAEQAQVNDPGVIASNDFATSYSATQPLTTKQAAGVIQELKKNMIQVTEDSPGIYRATSEKSQYIIEYDRNKCIGAASCAAIAPLTFFMDDENKAMFVESAEEDLDDDEVIMAGAQSCPVFAIKILDKSTGEVLFPVE